MRAVSQWLMRAAGRDGGFWERALRGLVDHRILTDVEGLWRFGER